MMTHVRCQKRFEPSARSSGHGLRILALIVDQLQEQGSEDVEEDSL